MLGNARDKRVEMERLDHCRFFGERSDALFVGGCVVVVEELPQCRLARRSVLDAFNRLA